MKNNVGTSWEPHIVFEGDNTGSVFACFSWFQGNTRKFTWYLRSSLSPEELDRYVNQFKFDTAYFVEYRGIVPRETIMELYDTVPEKDSWYRFDINPKGVNVTHFLIWATMIRTAQEHPNQAQDYLAFLDRFKFDNIQTYFLAMCYRNNPDSKANSQRGGGNHELVYLLYYPFTIINWKTLKEDFLTNYNKLEKAGVGGGFRVHITTAPLIKKQSIGNWQPGAPITEKRLAAFISGDAENLYV